MLEMLAYALGIMYSPGPVNLLSMNAGLQGRFRSTLLFFVGVACAMLILFLTFGYSGAWLVNEQNRPYISLLGACYIGWLAFKIGKSQVNLSERRNQNELSLTFRDGMLMQLLNPKGLLATLPIATIHFPAVGIHGGAIFLWSVALSILAFGAPGSYALTGSLLYRWVRKPVFFRLLNWFLSLMLWLVAIDIVYQHVYIPLWIS